MSDTPLRAAQAADAPAIHALLRVLGRPASDPPTPAQEAVLADHLGAEGCRIVVVGPPGEVDGFACLWIRARLGWETPEAWIADLVVRPGARRGGHARALVSECARLAREAGCHVLRLECGHQRGEAHALYAATGFRDLGVSYQRVLAGA